VSAMRWRSAQRMPRWRTTLLLVAGALVMASALLTKRTLVHIALATNEVSRGGDANAIANKPLRETAMQQRRVRPLLCRWSFSHYEPSEFENQWLTIMNADPRGERACVVLHAEPMNATAYALLGSTMTLNQQGRKPESWIEHTHLFSRLVYVRACSNGALVDKKGWQLIEPLYGILRDPCDSWCNPNNVCPTHLQFNSHGMSRRHILPFSVAPFAVALPSADIASAKWQTGLAPWFDCKSAQGCGATKGLVIDIGAALYDRWSSWEESGSQQFLVDEFTRAKIHLHDLYAFEAKPYNWSQVMKYVPVEVLHAYHWINLPVNANVGDKLNPWTVLLQTKALGNRDVTLVKLDIDTSRVENPLVEQILQDCRHDRKMDIDEFFYEHHVDFRPVWGWGKDGYPITGNDSYHMFLTLRRCGIRAHSWP